MLTYNLDNDKPLYVSLYEKIKHDIKSGHIKPNEKLPSKRQLSDHLGISVITVQNAYFQLASEGYVYSLERSGYFACHDSNNDFGKNIRRNSQATKEPSANHSKTKTRKKDNSFDSDTSTETLSNISKNSNTLDPITFYKNTVNSDNFPFSVWAKLMRKVLGENYDQLLLEIDNKGVFELRDAISQYLYHEKGIKVSAKNIIIGAGTEYLYGLIIKLLGRNNIWGIENPSYHKIRQVYLAENISLIPLGLDDQGLSYEQLRNNSIDILHISPNHQFPTGIVMPYSRRIQLLNWAYENENRYIIEDDYDSEFRLVGKPIPSLKSIDTNGKVIYINTFSKTIAPSLRISYLILPDELLKKFNSELGFLSSTVPSFEQYTLAKFISEGYFERYIKKMKKHYKLLRDEIISNITSSSLSHISTIKEENAGLYFALKLETNKSDSYLKFEAYQRGVKLVFLSDFIISSAEKNSENSATLILSYSDFHQEDFSKIISTIIDLI